MKTNEFEFEKRAMLTFKQYRDLVSYIYKTFNPKNLYLYLVNEYFDTPDLTLLNKGCVLRVRQGLEATHILTLKSPLADKSGDLETSQLLTIDEYTDFRLEAIFPDGPVKNKIKELNLPLNEIKYIAYLKCKRTEVQDGPCTIVLDENDYLGKIDHNIEVEGPSLEEAYKKILELSLLFNFKIKDRYVSKSRRVLLNVKR